MRTARLTIALLGALLPASLLPAQQSPAELAQRRRDKLARPVFLQNDWLLDFGQVKAVAKRDGKPIFVYFTRSYAPCAPCDTLENAELSTPRFDAFGKQVVLFLHCTSHTADEPLPTFAADRGFTSYPTLCFFDADGTLLAHIGDDKTVAVFEATLAKVRQLQALRARAAKGDAAADKQCFLLQLQLDALSLAEMQQRRQGVTGLTPEEVVLVDARMTDAQLDDLLRRARELGPQEVGKQLAGLARAGHRPSAAMINLFWNPVLTYARDARDADLAKVAFDALMSQYGKDRRYERAMQSWRQQLSEAGGK